MLIGALGCNFAWGVIDAILYLMGCLAERGRSIRALRALRTSRNAEEGRAIIANVLPPLIATMMSAADYERLREKLLRQAEPPDHPRLTRHDVLGAAGVFLWVFATTFPVAIPFLFLQDVERALRTSNAIAVALLFVNGYAYGRCSEYHPWWTGLAMVMLGSTLVGFTIALGG
jgi:VIT1/CCC1 family predicted Fe2+/Mn2+ transporter